MYCSGYDRDDVPILLCTRVFMVEEALTLMVCKVVRAVGESSGGLILK